ncbi:MAG TPA: hypothetical protein VM580_06925 [Labilithrix sp.]|nr:hypothetical protein [Labilithrix sp.]
MRPSGARYRFGLATVIASGALAIVQVCASCVDGVTPDCSDAACDIARYDDAGPDGTSIVLPDASDDSDADASSGTDGDAAFDAADGQG